MSSPFLVKIGTSLTMLSLNLRLPVVWLIRRTIFKQFCGGITKEECMPTFEAMCAAGVSSVLDYSVEGKENEAEFESIYVRKLNLIEYASTHIDLPFEVVKPTGLGRFEIWEKVSSGASLTDSERNEWQRVKNRVEGLCIKGKTVGVGLLFDAEETWMQKAADELLEEMMMKYNKEAAVVYNTLQCYRHDRLDYVKELHQKAKNKGFKVGIKVVRGAYMEKENLRAKKMGYPSPICPTKEATDATFNAVMMYGLEHLKDFSVVVGTHNEDSTIQAINFINDNNIAPDDRRVYFGQLFGMSDHITFNLGKSDYNTFKIIPFGPVRDVVPYLIRRAEENTSVSGQSNRELEMLQKEIKRRKAS
ncbi:MAG: proline dehydrogenase family protein [Flavobacteriaceae bacterium]|nr:proline dehydrogenase family protein [Flavobacteriaceae bacterium]